MEAFRLVEYNRDIIQIQQLFNKLNQQKEELEQISTRDISTGLVNRNGYNMYVQNFNKQKTSASKEIFPLGKIFRIGGDEFVIISERLTKNDIESAMAELLERIKAEGYSIAYGIAFGQQNMGIEEMIQEADHRILENKRDYYSNKERDRRKTR